MSEFRVCKKTIESHEVIETIKFDNKEDAEHYAKNQSVADHGNSYEIQKNQHGEFTTIKAYQSGQVTA